MKLNKILLILLLFLLTSGLCFATPVDITVFDGQSGTSTNLQWDSWWNNTDENDETEPGTTIGQLWDLEKIMFDSETYLLSISGGYDFLNGVKDTYSDDIIYSGDIFIDVNSSNDYYEYVLDLDFSSSSSQYQYTVYSNSGSGDVRKPTVKKVLSSPWRKGTSGWSNVSSTALPLPSSAQNFTYSDSSSDYDYMIADFDLNFLKNVPDYTGFDVHFTMECGNDLIKGNHPVPEPATMLLFGLGLLGIGAVSRKKLHNL